MGVEIGKEAKVTLARGQALAHEIEAAIKDTVISSAAGIETFHERREELTTVDHQFLFLYAVSLILFFASNAVNWTEEEINSIIDKAAEEIVREMRFRTAGQSDLEDESLVIARHLRDVFGNFRSNFSRLGESGKGEDTSNAISLFLMYLSEIHPASLTFLAEENMAVLVPLQQRFELISISAYRYIFK